MWIKNEYFNFLRFEKLKENFLGNGDDSNKILPIYERFVISLYNDCGDRILNYRVSPSKDFVMKSIEELPSLERRVDTIISDFNNFIHPEEEFSIKITEKEISYGTFSIERNERIDLILFLSGEKGALKIFLRNSTIPNFSQTWSLVPSFAERVFGRGITNEGFSSPFNSYFLGKGRWCSLFPDIESKIGSLGNFFDVDFNKIRGGWLVNPPFIEEIMEKVIDKILIFLTKIKKGK